MTSDLLINIGKSPTAYHAVSLLRERLQQEGYISANEQRLQSGENYFYTVHDSCLIAFRLPEQRPTGAMIAAAHGDSPCFRLREDPERKGDYVRLSVERYGGMLNDSWLDRPLSIAGRVTVRTPEGLETKLIDFRRPVALIPRVAIHLNRDANNGAKYDPARDLVPLYGAAASAGAFKKALAELTGNREEDILATDLILYDPEPGILWGPEGEFLSSPRLDDLACVFSCANAFLSAKEKNTVPMLCVFDNEEIGSETKQGAASPWLAELLERIAAVYDLAPEALRKNSLLLSCDNGHAKHPNHPELADALQAPVLGQGVVVKHSTRYATDGVSAGIFTEICHRAGVPLQHYANRPDQAGGATLGNIATTKLPVLTVDIGMAQLAMHSCFETASAKDVEYLTDAVKAVYETEIEWAGNRVLIR